MKAVWFEGCNAAYAEHQEEYETLPSFRTPDEHGIVVSCWKTSLAERWRILFTGRVWLSVCTFNRPLQPVRVEAGVPEEFVRYVYGSQQAKSDTPNGSASDVG